MGNRGANRRPTHGIWTHEKLAIARRRFGEVMIKLAAELQVPAKELLDYGVHGTIPPMGPKQRVAQLIEDRSQAAAEQTPQRLLE